MKNFLRGSSFFVFLITLGLFFFDQVTKYFFYTKHFGTGFFFIVPSFNHGVSWSMPVPYVIILLLSFFALGWLVLYFLKKKISFWVFCFLFAGLVGNLLDRILFHGVRDFLAIHVFNFPIFNFADVFLTVGVFLLLKQEFFTWKRREKQ